MGQGRGSGHQTVGSGVVVPHCAPACRQHRAPARAEQRQGKGRRKGGHGLWLFPSCTSGVFNSRKECALVSINREGRKSAETQRAQTERPTC